MDAVEFLKNFDRMCALHPECDKCKAEEYCFLGHGKSSDSEKLVKVVEEWAKEHPVKTRASEFLKMFPNCNFAINHGETINLCPRNMDRTLYDREYCAKGDCSDCKKKYWSEEIE